MTSWSANFIGIGRATLVDDTGELQLIQVTEGAAGDGFADRVTDKVRRVAEFGFASVPPLGAEVLVLRRSGDRSRSMVVGTSHRPSRPKNLQPGDSVVYDVRGIKLQMTAGGLLIDCAGLPAIVQNATIITLKATQKVTIDAPLTETTGDLTVEGHSLSALRTAYDGHKHGGVAGGSGLTATTDTPAS